MWNGHPALAKHDKDTTVRTAKSGYSDIVLVCAKCTKRVGLKKDEIRGRLKREAKRRGLGGMTRVVSTGCLGPCPKRFRGGGDLLQPLAQPHRAD